MKLEEIKWPDEVNWIMEKFNQYNIPQLFYNAEFSRIRRILKEITLSEEMDIDALGFERFTARLEIWNQIGLPLLNKFNRPYDAEDLYKDLLEILLELESKSGKHYHKGMPAHNLGVSLLVQRQNEKAQKYFLIALKDDIILSREKDIDFTDFLAYKTLEEVYEMKPPPDTPEKIDAILEDMP